MRAWGLSDPGMVRTQNQDAFVMEELSENCRLAVVCDGMGGALAGNVASQLALEMFTAQIRFSWQEGLSVDETAQLLRDAVYAANEAVYQRAVNDPECTGMGTTLVAALIDNDCLHVVNVGDSRAYVTGISGIKMVTTDHSFVQLMVQRGELSQEEAKNHPGKNLITRAVGTEKIVQADVYHLDADKWDCLVLCSDGLSNVMADQEILFEVAHGEKQDDCCQRLLDIAKNRGAPDNVTVVVVSR